MLPIQKLFSSNERLLKLTLEGISHEESLKEMHNCNSVNWILGHFVFIRNNILSQLGLPPLADEKMKEVYARGVVKPDMKNAVPLDTLKKTYEESQLSIMKKIEEVKDEAILEQITFLGVHEAYHIGQIGLLRKMLGKEGAIR
jgi:hypothetical protein